MPQFSTSEKDQLHDLLVQAGKQLFTTQGLKKTSLEQLTQAAGIAKSTFYSFFDSKETLYLDLLELESIEMEERVWTAVEQASGTYNAIIAYLRQMGHELSSNPLTKRLIAHPEEMELVRRRVTSEFIGRKLQRNVMPLMKYVSEQQQAGQMTDMAPEVIVGVLRAAMLIEVHRQDFDETFYPQIKDVMYRAVASSLTSILRSNEE
ncbi:TetR/AcrR family transcriptional regulator [Paenibacillus arenilitoris]|uniref:TetR/AcrR family transcriptional regulator n=1 Tax=Paenibacillus arenilitoris TaxID=2772299 RepID=A0A927H8V0_9BACL|nr:TetR/AcrR family transcriptional regulator [Paenibacillus arenilitoris]MBD2871952.1 TetR/AcrR family transcriptional regulator [Paenibacillus arenilitoris]